MTTEPTFSADATTPRKAVPGKKSPSLPLRPEKPGLYDWWVAYLSQRRGPSRIRTGLWIVFLALAALVALFWISVANFSSAANGTVDAQSVVAVMGVVVSPIVSVVGSYFGITMATRSSSGAGDGDAE
ncbi:hypothetical protein GR927_20590 [Mycolicibacterium sp. 3033]|nr:hypothetical protein [Mycolicibacterium aurantiacum]